MNEHVAGVDAKDLEDACKFSTAKVIGFGDFQVLALGEQSHGTSQFFKARTALIKLMAEQQHALTKIGLEAPWAEVEELNKYVLEGDGDLKAILKSFRLYFYECDEFAELVETVKGINSKGLRRLSFFGFDIQSPYKILDNLITYSESSDVSNVDSIKSLIMYYRQLDNEVYSHMFNPDDFRQIHDLSQRIISDFDTATKDKNNLNNNKSTINNSLRNYRYFLQLNNPEITQWDSGKMSDIRDSLMAENVINNLSDHDKMVILAHNAHIQKTRNPYSKSMGQFLLAKIGDDYKCVAMTTSTGFVTAYNNQKQRITSTNPIILPDSSAFEYYFSKVQYPVFFLDTRHIKKASYNPAPVQYRLLPAGYIEKQFIRGNVFEDFDFIIHLDNTKGSKSFYLK